MQRGNRHICGFASLVAVGLAQVHLAGPQAHAVLEKVLGALFRIFPQAERGFVLLKREGATGLAPQAIKIREGSKKLTVLETSIEFASHQVAPRWLQVDHPNLSGKVLALPKREDVNLPVNEQLIVELYSK